MSYSLYKTKYGPSEVKDILQKELKASLFFNWNVDTYIGKTTEKKFCYFFHRAYIRNSFTKVLKGRIFEDNGMTHIKVKFTSALLNLQTILIIHFVMGFFIMTDYLANGLRITFFGAFLRLIFSGFIFSGFIILIGAIVSIIPISNTYREKLINLLEEKLLVEKV